MHNTIAQVKSRIKRKEDYKKSYSQSGEDLIVDFAFNELRIPRPSYLDLGAHHPTYLSNTYLFYQKGGRGACLEPDPALSRIIQKVRPNDNVINAGIGSEDREADFYILSSETLSTFSKKEAKRFASYGNEIKKIIRVPLLSPKTLIENHLKYSPDFVSLDIEGLDLEVLKAWPFDQHRPKIFCVETLTYTEDKTEKKMKDIITFMQKQNFFEYGDTYINTIFVDSKAWKERK